MKIINSLCAKFVYTALVCFIPKFLESGSLEQNLGFEGFPVNCADLNKTKMTVLDIE